jgi:glycosyltransferase involved in cell wall biosynthesis
VFGVYAPAAAAALFSFLSHAVDLTGGPDAIQVRVATHNPPATAAPRISTVAAGDPDDFVAAIDVLAVPVYDDAVAGALMAALRSGKSVIVPDRGGGAELIEYGRHGLMFGAGSAYHLAGAINLISQGWSEKPVLFATGGPAVARTQPSAVAASFATVWERAVAARDQNGARPAPASA